MIYIVRVELHGATSVAIYERLHANMESMGFSRQMLMSDNKFRSLPWAEYCYQGNSDMSTITSAAKSAAEATGFRYSLLVSQANNVQLFPVV